MLEHHDRDVSGPELGMLYVRLALALCCALSLSHARAGTLHVPQDFPTIQAALDAAAADDVVLIQGALYAVSVTASLPDNVTIRGKGSVRIDATGLGAGLTVDGLDLQVIDLKVIGGTEGLRRARNAREPAPSHAMALAPRPKSRETGVSP
jgi:hypothetical protein